MQREEKEGPTYRKTDGKKTSALITMGNCMKRCPEECINTGNWQYYDGINADEDHPESEWKDDPGLNLICLDGNGNYKLIISYWSCIKQLNNFS